MNDELKKSEQKASSETLDKETRAYLKEWANAFVDGARHEEAKQIADNKIKKEQ